MTESTFTPIATIHVEDSYQQKCDDPGGSGGCPVPPKGSLVQTVTAASNYFRGIGKWETGEAPEGYSTRIMNTPKQNYSAYHIFCCLTKFGMFLQDSYTVVFNGYPIAANGEYISKAEIEQSDGSAAPGTAGPSARIQLFAELYKDDAPVDAKHVPKQDIDNFLDCMQLCKQTETLAMLYHPDFEYLKRSSGHRFSPGWVRSVIPAINPQDLQVQASGDPLPSGTVQNSWAVKFYYYQGALYGQFNQNVQYRTLYHQVTAKLRNRLSHMAKQHVLLLSPNDEKFISNAPDAAGVQQYDSLLPDINGGKFYRSRRNLLRLYVGLDDYQREGRTLRHVKVQIVRIPTKFDMTDTVGFERLKQIIINLLPNAIISIEPLDPTLQDGATIGVRGKMILNISINTIEDLATANLLKQDLPTLYDWEFLIADPLYMMTSEFQQLSPVKYYRGLFLVPVDNASRQKKVGIRSTDDLLVRAESSVTELGRQGIFSYISIDQNESKAIEFISRNFDIPIVGKRSFTEATTIYFLQSLIFDSEWFHEALFDYRKIEKVLVTVSPRDGTPFDPARLPPTAKLLPDGRMLLLVTGLSELTKSIQLMNYIIG
jgi:hypothetical protein